MVNTSHHVTKVKHVELIRYCPRVIIIEIVSENSPEWVRACNNCDHYRFTRNSQAKVLVHEPMPAKLNVHVR